MRWRELQRYARRLKSSGYPTTDLETALYSKFATPALVPLMALLAVPFAFRIGRRGALAGIGVGLAELLSADKFVYRRRQPSALRKFDIYSDKTQNL